MGDSVSSADHAEIEKLEEQASALRKVFNIAFDSDW